MHTGEMIRTLRKSKGMSQMKLAERIGISYQQVQKYENGKSQLTVSRLRQLAAALNVPPRMLIEDLNNSVMKDLPVDHDEVKILSMVRELNSRRINQMVIKFLKAISETIPAGF